VYRNSAFPASTPDLAFGSAKIPMLLHDRVVNPNHDLLGGSNQ